MSFIRRNIISLILNAILFILWSFVGIGRAITDPSWMLLVYGGLMAIYLVLTIDEARTVAQHVKVIREHPEVFEDEDF